MLMRRAKAYSCSCSQTVSLSPAICRSSFLECALQPKIAKINKKNPHFRSLGSFKIINVDMTEKLVIMLVVIGSMSVPICTVLTKKLTSNGKIMTFMGVPLFDDLVRRFPSTYKIKTWTVKIYVQCRKFHMQLFYVYLNCFWRSSLLKCVLQSEIAKKSIKTLILAFKVIQGH